MNISLVYTDPSFDNGLYARKALTMGFMQEKSFDNGLKKWHIALE